MIVYVEKILIINILVHLIIIISTHFILNNAISKKGTFVSVIIDACFMLMNIYYPEYNENTIFFIGIIIATIPFKSQKCYAAILYHILNFMLGGVSDIITISVKYFYEVILVVAGILLVTIIYFSRNKTDNKMKITIIDDNNIHTLDAFVDTGCQIYCGLTPVLLVNEKIKLDLKYIEQIKVETISGEKLMNIYKARRVYCINNKTKVEKHCFIAFSKMDYESIVGKNVIGGLKC